jgi:acyl carrier protein
MTAFTLADLAAAAIAVIGNRRIELREEMSARDVPGWDSLSHTLIALEVSARVGRDISAREMAEAATFGEVVALINRDA